MKIDLVNKHYKNTFDPAKPRTYDITDPILK